MTDTTDTHMKTIENARLDNVRPGDHIIWTRDKEYGGVISVERREGTAHHRDASSNWRTESGTWITGGEGEGTTLTIHRPVQELPTEDGVVIVPADDREFIEVNDGGRYYVMIHAGDGWWRGGPDEVSSVDIIDGTWKVAER